MTTRLVLNDRMRALQDDLLAMGDTAITAIARATKALVEHDADEAHDVIRDDQAINDRYAAIDRAALELLATQQPMAGDLRFILAASSIAGDLERIGDYAKGIANIALRTIDAPVPATAAQIVRMSEIVRELLAAELAALVRRDEQLARSQAARDTEVDRIYDHVYHDLVRAMMVDPEAIPGLDRFMWSAKSLERAGDHVTNIGERIVFLCSGDVVELNPPESHPRH